MPIKKSKIVLSVVSGILLGISFPKVGIWWSAWFGFVPFFVALRGLSWKDSFSIGFINGFVQFLVLGNWLFFVLRVYSGMGVLKCLLLFLIFLFYLSLYTAVFAILISFFAKKTYDLLLIGPASWVVLEFFRGILFTGFPWGYVGYSQFEQLKIIQISDILGVYGVSFLIVAVNVTLYLFILFLSGKKWCEEIVSIRVMFRSFLVVVTIVIAFIVYGNWRVNEIDRYLERADYLKVGVVQGNIDPSIKWDPVFQITTTKKYIKLSERLSKHNPDLIVWPETATPFNFEASPKLTAYVVDSIKEIGTNFVIGSPSVAQNCKNNDNVYFNSAYLIGSNGQVEGKYDKSHLVPFGEYRSLGKASFFVGDSNNYSSDFRPGSSGKVLFLSSKKKHLGLQICYEIIFPSLSRLLVKNGANVLINLTNDAWFGNSPAAYQHFSMSIFRAIENRRSLVRAANTGVSGFIDPTGRILKKTPIFSDEILMNQVPLLSLRTIYSISGDLFIVVCSVFLVVFMRIRMY